MTALLAAHSTALAAVIEHSGGLRVHGGAVLVHAASVLFDADAHWAAVIGGTRSAGGAGPPGVGVPDAPQKVTPSQMPAPVGTPGVTGEQFSVYVHSGAGSALLRDFAEAWLTHATGLEGLSERVHSHGLSIDEHWSGGQRAGAKTREHGEWLGDGADQARLVARTADALATQFDAAKAATPTPPLSAAPEIARTDAQALSQGLLGGAKEHLGADGDEIDPNTGGVPSMGRNHFQLDSQNSTPIREGGDDAGEGPANESNTPCTKAYEIRHGELSKDPSKEPNKSTEREATVGLQVGQVMTDSNVRRAEDVRDWPRDDRAKAALVGYFEAIAREDRDKFAETAFEGEGLDFRGADLSGIDFLGAQLGVANLSGVRFVGADLYRAWLMGTDMRGADFTRADLRKVQGRECDGRDANFSEARFDRADFDGADFRHACFHEADFGGCYLYGADLRGADLRGVLFSKTKIDEVRLGGSQLDGVRGSISGTVDIGADVPEPLDGDELRRWFAAQGADIEVRG